MVAAAAALVAAVATPLTSWLISRTSRKDKRQNIARDLEILKNLNPASEIYKSLENRVSRDIQKVVTQADIRDEVGPVWRKYFVILGLIALASTLRWASFQEWVPENSNTSIFIVRIACWTIAGALALQLSAKLIKVFWLAAPIGWMQATIHLLQLKFAYAKVQTWQLKRKEKLLLRRRARKLEKETHRLDSAVTERFRTGASLEEVLESVDSVPTDGLNEQEVERIRQVIIAAHQKVIDDREQKAGYRPAG